MLNQSCEQFLEVLSSAAPVPGGGGASALAGAMGVALGSMVANLTLGKKKYADVQQDIERILNRSRRLMAELQELVAKDAEAFEPLSRAYGLPKDTPEQQQEKDRVLEEALWQASIVPLAMMEKAVEAMVLQQELAEKGTRIALSDVGVGVQMLRAALLGASMNVWINLKLMKNTERAAELRNKTEALLTRGVALADAVFERVSKELIP